MYILHGMLLSKVFKQVWCKKWKQRCNNHKRLHFSWKLCYSFITHCVRSLARYGPQWRHMECFSHASGVSLLSCEVAGSTGSLDSFLDNLTVMTATSSLWMKLVCVYYRQKYGYNPNVGKHVNAPACTVSLAKRPQTPFMWIHSVIVHTSGKIYDTYWGVIW